MVVELQFDPNQAFQQDAIRSVVDLFSGQSLAPTQFELQRAAQGVLLTEHGVGNALALDIAAVSSNLRSVQERNGIPEALRLPEDVVLGALDFTTEMETGTGKTYVYLRSALELNKTYGFTKFVVVVPSVAIREGVVSNLRLLADHFKTLYSGAAYESGVYDPANPAALRAYAQSNQLQILVINIDAFNKSINVIYQGRDNTMGVPPIEFLQATRAIVVLDEPQNLEGEAARKAVAALNPLAVLRYSATHRSMPNPIYRLTPVDAYNAGLVKQIEVWPVREDQDLNRPYVEVTSVKASRRSVTADLVIDVEAGGVVQRRKVKAAVNSDGVLPDLFDLSGGRELYRGYAIEDIRADLREVSFGNGIAVREGEKIGADTDAIQRVTIRTAVQHHLEKERELQNRHARGDLPSPMKPLTLFFIDRVANYHSTDGKFRQWFTEAYVQLAALPKYNELKLPPVDEVHGGYFAEDRSGPRDTSGSTKADDAAYEKIMRQKDVLLSPGEPLRFIWSHSALREGWDNPNVFIIATLNETRSTIKKRQEIGRGLRLPVMANGERCRDPEIARLLIVANESYDDFASALQREIEDDTSTSFPKNNVKNARNGRKVSLKNKAALDPEFNQLWSRISTRTRYVLDYDTSRVVESAAARLAAEPTITAPKIRVEGARIRIDADMGVTAEVLSTRSPIAAGGKFPVPDLLSHLANDVPLTRATIARVLIRSRKLPQASVNPQRFIEQARTAMHQALGAEVLNGIKYIPIEHGEDAAYEMRELTDREATSFGEQRLLLQRSAMTEVMCDSDVEVKFAQSLDAQEGVEWFIKLPWWFKVETPVGNYNPDWAIMVRRDDGRTKCYLLRETKGVTTFANLASEEQLKIQYGEKHFDAIDVDYTWLDSAHDLRIRESFCEPD